MSFHFWRVSEIKKKEKFSDIKNVCMYMYNEKVLVWVENKQYGLDANGCIVSLLGTFLLFLLKVWPWQRIPRIKYPIMEKRLTSMATTLRNGTMTRLIERNKQTVWNKRDYVVCLCFASKVLEKKQKICSHTDRSNS